MLSVSSYLSVNSEKAIKCSTGRERLIRIRLIRSYCEIFVYNCPNISCLKYTVNSNFHLIRSKTLPPNDFELTVPDLYYKSFKVIIGDS